MEGFRSFIFTIFIMRTIFGLQQFKAGDIAPSFVIQTLRGKFVYNAKALNDSKDSNSIIFCAFTKHSAFLRALWTEEGSIRRLLERSPRNTHYVFLSLSENAKQDVEYMQKTTFNEMAKLHNEKKEK